MKKQTTEERFWSKVDRTDIGCWEWKGSKQGRPGMKYGSFSIHGRDVAAHRFSYRLHVGEIPEGMEICHHCDNPGCVRPDHLFLGTRSDNMKDKVKKGRANTPRGEQNTKAKLTEQQVITIREEFARGGISKQELANKYGVARSLVLMIVRGETWKHVGGPIGNPPAPPKTNTGFYGVSKTKYESKHRPYYQAWVDYKKTRYALGVFDNPVDAARARDAKVIELGIPDVILNFPDEEAA